MRQADTAYLTMVSATLKVLAANEDAWKDNKPAARQVAAIRAGYAALSNAQQAANTVTTGVTEDKEAAGDAAIKLAVKLAGYAQAYALENKNMTLYEQMRVNFTMLDRLPDETLAQRLTDLYLRLSKLGEPAEEYGVTAKALEKLKRSIDLFDNMKSEPRLIITDRKGHNQTVPQLIRGLRLAYKILDKLMKGIEEEHPKLARDYYNARPVINRVGSGDDDEEKGDKPEA